MRYRSLGGHPFAVPCVTVEEGERLIAGARAKQQLLSGLVAEVEP